MSDDIILFQVAMVQDISEGLDDIFRWRSMPKSLVSMIIFVVGVLYVELWMAPLALSLLLLYNVSSLFSNRIIFLILSIFLDRLIYNYCQKKT